MGHKFHKYQRVQNGWKKDSQGKRTTSPYIVFKCLVDGCKHFISEDLAEGRKAQCFYCGDTYILTGYVKRLKFPHCGCRFEKVESEIPDFLKILQGDE